MDRAFEDIDGDFAITWVKDSNKKIHLARESGRPMVVAYWRRARVLLWASTKEIMEDAMIRAGLRLPIKEVEEDYIFTYNTDEFDSRPSVDKVEFETISQYGYSYNRFNWRSSGEYFGGVTTNMSPATKSLNSISNCDKDVTALCYYCYEHFPETEVYHNMGRPICIQCEFVEYNDSYKEGNKKGESDEGEFPF
jgi:hypothetical protein